MVEAGGEGVVLENFAGVRGDGADAVFRGGAVQEVAALEEEAAVFGKPGEVGAGCFCVGHGCFLDVMGWTAFQVPCGVWGFTYGVAGLVYVNV